MSEALPAIALQPRTHKRVLEGSPWAYSNEIAMTAETKALPPGTLVRLTLADGRLVGLAHFNPHTLIGARLLTRHEKPAIDLAFWQQRLATALAMREKIFSAPYYRWVHAEGDNLPGLIVDRYGDVVVMQANTAGMDAVKGVLAEAIVALIQPKTILLRGDTPARALEGLAQENAVLHGAPAGLAEVLENGITYHAQLVEGQKTGWFYDQRANRLLVADLAKGASMLDLYCHSGGFALLAAKKGASTVCGVDSSEPALTLARNAAAANHLENVSFERKDVFEFCAHARDSARRYGVVVADPPAFAKSKKDVGAALRGYRKLAKLAAGLVEPGGFLFIASCSHAILRDRFDAEICAGAQEAKRDVTILARTGADRDHPGHAHLPESVYLKGILLHVR